MQQGCAHKAPDYSPQSIGKTAIIVKAPAGKEPLEIPGRRQVNETGKGALIGSGLGELGAICGPGFIVCMPALAIFGSTIGAIGGAVYGAAKAAPQPIWQDAEIALRAALAELVIDKKIANEIVMYAQANGYQINVPPGGIGLEGKEALPCEALAREGFGTVLEISGTSVTLVPAELTVNPLRQFAIMANVRLIRTDDSSVLDERIVSSDLGPPRPIEEWMADNAWAFREEIPRALQRFAENIIEEFFMLHRFPVQTVSLGWMFDAHVKGLKPVYPPLQSPNSIFPNKPPESDSLRPTMKWEPFDASAVTYDLRIWDSIESGRSVMHGDVIYSRERLVDTWHTLDAPLELSSYYFWSVRAHFVHDGKGRVTEWSRYCLIPANISNILTLGLTSIFPCVDVFYNFLTHRD
jgi:hypothetical protein